MLFYLLSTASRFLIFFHCPQITFTAERFVFGSFSQKYLLVVLNGAVREGCQLPALHTDGMNFRNFVGNGTQAGHRAEWKSAEVHIQTGNNNAYAIVGKLITDINQTAVEELCFIDSSISEVNSRMLAEESIGVDAMEWLSCDTTSSSE